MVSIGQLKNLKDGQRHEQIQSLGTLARMKLVHLASIALSKATGEVEAYTKILHDLTNDLWSEAKRDEDVTPYLEGEQEMETTPRGYTYTPAEIAQSRARLTYNRETRNVDSRGVPFSSVMEESAYMGPTKVQERYVTDWK